MASSGWQLSCAVKFLSCMNSQRTCFTPQAGHAHSNCIAFAWLLCVFTASQFQASRVGRFSCYGASRSFPPRPQMVRHPDYLNIVRECFSYQVVSALLCNAIVSPVYKHAVLLAWPVCLCFPHTSFAVRARRKLPIPIHLVSLKCAFTLHGYGTLNPYPKFLSVPGRCSSVLDPHTPRKYYSDCCPLWYLYTFLHARPVTSALQHH